MTHNNFDKIPTFKFALKEGLSDIFLPTRAEPLASGWDVRVSLTGNKAIEIKPMEYVKLSLGFRAFCPKGWWLELKPRSSTFTKKNLHALYGTVDETYEGEMIFAAQYVVPETTNEVFTNILQKTSIIEVDTSPLVLNHGDAIGQIIPIRREEMVIERVTNEEYDALCKQRNAARGVGGFGSTG